MKWTVQYDSTDRIVKVTVTGALQADFTAQMAIQGIAEARKNATNLFLIDYTKADVADSLVDTYTFMEHLGDLGILHTDRIAIVYSKNSSQHRFAETVAYNRAWSDTLKYFSDIQEARDWLFISKS